MTASGIGSSLATGIGQVAGKAMGEAKEAARITAVRADTAAVQAEINTACTAIGKAYVDAAELGAGTRFFTVKRCKKQRQVRSREK